MLMLWYLTTRVTRMPDAGWELSVLPPRSSKPVIMLSRI